MTSDKKQKKAWLTTWASGGVAGKPVVASMTLNNIHFGVQVRDNFGEGFQVGISPMGIEELVLIRDALNTYFEENGL